MIRIRHLSQRRGVKWDFPDFSNKNRDLPNQVDILEWTKPLEPAYFLVRPVLKTTKFAMKMKPLKLCKFNKKYLKYKNKMKI